MKIGKERIKGLVQRNIASGLAYYWYPDPRERAAGWKSLALGNDLGAAIEKARARNNKVAEWKSGGASPTWVRRYNRPQTYAALLDRFEKEKLPGLAANTQRTLKTEIRRHREWAGKHPVAWITPQRVRALKLALCPQADQVPKLLREGHRDIPGHSHAFRMLCAGRDIFTWATRPSIAAAASNPFADFELPKPPPRQQLWDRECETAFAAAAGSLGWHSIGFALRMAINFGQREADMLALTRSHWREITIEQLDGDRDLYAALASPHGPDAGKAMGFYLGQAKGRTAANPGGVQVGVPIAGDMRDAVEAMVAAAADRATARAAGGAVVPFTAMHLIVRDKMAEGWRGRDMTGEKWSQRDFIEKVALVRAHAVKTAREAGDMDLATRLEQLQFLDTRRTCVTRLADLGMSTATIAARTGHSLKTVENILKTYLVRTVAQAGRGSVAMLADERRRRDSEKTASG